MRLGDVTIDEFLASVAAKTPTPGGGAVASFTAALAAALAQMVINYSVGKKSLAAHHALHMDAFRELVTLSQSAIELAEADARAYARLNELWKLDKNDPVRRSEFAGAVEAAIAAPKSVMELALRMLDLMTPLLGTTNAHLNSDLAIAAVLAEAAARCAAWNVRINLPQLEDADRRAGLEAELQTMLQQASSHAATIEGAMH